MLYYAIIRKDEGKFKQQCLLEYTTLSEAKLFMTKNKLEKIDEYHSNDKFNLVIWYVK